MATTIKDIAAALGCSPSTVSRALHDHPQINEGTKRAVRVMAKKMNFQINQVAAGLRKHKTFCIGCLFNFGIFSTVLPHELLWFSFNFFLLNTISHVLQTTFLASYNVIVLISSSSTKTSFGGESGQSFAEMISVSPSVNSQYQISIKFAKFQCYSKDDM